MQMTAQYGQMDAMGIN